MIHHCVLLQVSLFLLALIHRSEAAENYSCAVGSFVLEECGGLGEPNKLRLYLDTTCDFVINVDWGFVSLGYAVNSTELTALLDDDVRTLAAFPVEYAYTSPGEYSIDLVVRGYDNFTDPDKYQIEVEIDEVVRLGIWEGFCEELPDSGARTLTSGITLALSSLSIAGLALL